MAISAALDAARRLGRGHGKGRRGRAKRLRRLLARDEGIRMVERRHGYFPAVFVWRRRRYRVYAVERCWTVSRSGFQGAVERRVFRVRARSRSSDPRTERTLEIYQDVGRDGWYVRCPSR